MKRQFSLLSVFTLATALMATTVLPKAHSAVPEPLEAPHECQLKIGTGTVKKGFSNLFADINSVCGKEVSICESGHSTGGLKNLTLLSQNDVDLGMVQLDTLLDMKSTDDNIGALLAVVPLNYNLLHILTKAGGYTYSQTKAGEKKAWGLMKGDDVVTNTTVTISKFSDLKGKTVAVVGSAQLMGRTLNKTLGMNMQFVDVDDDQAALAKVKSGEVQALLTVSGWPSGVVKGLTQASGFALVPFDGTAFPPYVLIKKPYANMATYNMTFLATPSLLLTRPFRASGPNGKLVAALQACILRNIPDLQEGAFQPGWKDVKGSGTFGWPAFVAESGAVTVGGKRGKK